MGSHKAFGRAPRRTAYIRSQRGFALLLTVFLLIAGVATAGLTFYRPTKVPDLPAERTAEKFAEVKAALIGYAARQGVFQCTNPSSSFQCNAQLAASPKLGELPCPDIDDDGEAEASCANARLGRVPWRTLGIPAPQDGSGETFWYAVSLRFLNNASNPITKVAGYVSSGALNSSTVGDLTVRSADGTTVTTTAVAVLFSAGSVVSGQNRSPSGSAYCVATKSNLQRHLCPGNYLESFGGTDNAAGTGTYIRGTPSAQFNDRLVYLSPGELMPTLEMRLGAELSALLLQYKYNSDCFCYPWADSWNYSGGIADIGLNRGRLPTTAQPEAWGSGSIPRFPDWIKDNDWHNQLFYIASKRATDQSGPGCRTCSSNLQLTIRQTPALASPTEPADVALITPGPPQPGVNRPFLPLLAVLDVALPNVFASYFEDALNDKTGCYGNDTEHATATWFPKQTAPASCDTLVMPQSRAHDRDRLWQVRKDPAIICPLAGRALVNQSPCKDNSSDQVKDVCTSLAAELAQCSTSCSAAGQQMLVVPCRNNSSSSHCPGPRAALLACTT